MFMYGNYISSSYLYSKGVFYRYVIKKKYANR